MLNIIIGKNSNLSKVLEKYLPDTILVSTINSVKELDALNLSSEKSINIIFNNFQMATKLNDLSHPKEYIERAIMSTSMVLEYIKTYNLKINKIIYTSSSSVYGNNVLCTENDPLLPLNLHASLKVANEKMIEKFSIDNGIDYTIARIFNMYGGEDRFSIVSKIIGAYNKKNSLTIVNDGNGIRDFIHIEDVVYIYTKIIRKKNISILNIGTGEGRSIRNILGYLKNYNFEIQTNTIKREELKISTADNTYLRELIEAYCFKDVEEFIKESIEEKGNE